MLDNRLEDFDGEDFGEVALAAAIVLYSLMLATPFSRSVANLCWAGEILSPVT